jgi:hypothetical protein
MDVHVAGRGREPGVFDIRVIRRLVDRVGGAGRPSE